MSTSIAQWHRVCIGRFEAFHACLKSDGQYNNQVYCQFFDEHGRFNVWAGNIGARQNGRASLDFRLREAEHIKDQVVSLLRYLSETLDDDSESSDEDELLPESTSSERLKRLGESISKIVANLYKTSVVIRRGNNIYDRLVRSAKIDVSYYEPFDVQHARNKFPAADEWLVAHLGKANSRRRQYLEYWLQHHEKLAAPAQTISAATAQGTPAAGEDDSRATRTVREESATLSGSHGSSTTATTLVASNTPESADVDVYSKSGTVSSDQASLAGDEKLNLPLPPKESIDGQDFQCPYCYTVCRLTGKTDTARKREWKRHVFRDLQPYTCTFAQCPRADRAFERKSEWFRHESQAHRREWCCNAPGHRATQDGREFKKHMEEAHGISDFQEEAHAVLALCERPLQTTRSSCSLCHATEANELSPEQLKKHLAQHLESLALFALPRNNDKRGEKSAASDVAAEASKKGHLSTSSPSAGENPKTHLAAKSSASSDLLTKVVAEPVLPSDSPITQTGNDEDSTDYHPSSNWASALPDRSVKGVSTSLRVGKSESTIWYCGNSLIAEDMNACHHVKRCLEYLINAISDVEFERDRASESEEQA
ncbi:uncharacterized protein KY384_000476 [Bacidia gigantensis]|uniref:uncharacterized protein n=1 Tax=Bacidia gigantensis TaxID=2732470 RepID=UPI001D04252E|nr:uncharacterized protein KY384_000476 [Bacidia gigantensis]KAG8525716.1 hypothetical protein KY384_000476 [Bacidia gigantensis]